MLVAVCVTCAAFIDDVKHKIATKSAARQTFWKVEEGDIGL
jgi:hypothetical protein